MKVGRREAIAVALGAALVVAAFVVPHLHLGIVTPLINSTPERFKIFAGTAPIFGWWNAHVGWGTVPAIVIGIAAVLWGPTVAQRLPWRALTWATWATSCAWAFSLAMIDGWQRGFAGRLTARHEYLRQVPTITDIPEAVRDFASRIPDFQPNSWITHVSGHPPGALLTFVWLDRIGLGGGAWAGLLCLLVGSSAAAAIVVAVRALDRRGHGPTRRAVRRGGADGHLGRGLGRRLLRRRRGMGYRAAGAGRAAHGAAAGARRPRVPACCSAGAIFLNYGLALMALPARRRADRRRGLAIRPAGAGSRCAGGAGGRRGVRGRGVLVVRRLHACAATLLAGHRDRPAVPVLVVGEPRVGGVRDRVGQRGRYRPGLRHRGDQAALRPAPRRARRAARDPVRGSVAC